MINNFLFFFSSRRRHTRCALVTGVQTCALPIFIDRKDGNADPFRAAKSGARRCRPERGFEGGQIAPHDVIGSFSFPFPDFSPDRSQGGAVVSEVADRPRPKRLFRKRWLTAGAVGVLALGLWMGRVPLADRFIRDQLDSRGIPARYTIDAIGFRTERLVDVVNGDPKRTDLTETGKEHVRN